MFDLNTLTEKNISDLKKDLMIKKTFFLKKIKENNKREILKLPHQKNIFASSNLNINGGNIRNLSFIINTKDENNKQIILLFYFEDYSCGIGKYINNTECKTNFNNYPTAWQNYSFEHKKYFSIRKLKSLKETYGEEVLDNGVFEEELKELKEFIYLTFENRKKQYDEENLNQRIKSFEENKNNVVFESLINSKKEEINYVKTSLDNSNAKSSSSYGSKEIIY